MGVLKCTRCLGTVEKPTIQEAIDSLDHGVGNIIGRPCPNDGTNILLWNGQPVSGMTILNEKAEIVTAPAPPKNIKSVESRAEEIKKQYDTKKPKLTKTNPPKKRK